MEYFKLGIAAIFVSNFVLAQFLGLCPFIGVSRKSSDAIGMGFAVIFVMTMASAVTYIVYMGVLVPGSPIFGGSPDVPGSGDYRYLNIVVFILVIASLVQLVEMIMEKTAPALYQALGIYLPLITTNCAVLGVTQLNVSKFADMTFGAGLLRAVLYGFCAGLGFMLAMILMSGIRERLELAPVPQAMKGVPVAFITTSCMALAFLGFSGMV